ncbi:hypothetical protein ACFOTA_22490 [Chitinophaga sp. GCM10012297]|uniref:Uncharacterized protein n=1 Tax=Chitinophaga chungangae TaxID=2821488 RepID=A0ABS3YK13_9BACT|nr:hypothetical protein [Chitinophaga chungangae]MBO9154999.1 hypothetical protein [Chitinophaga chungangae]
MKHILILFLSVCTFAGYGQDKAASVHFNHLTEVPGTEYVIATVENYGKAAASRSRYLLFINSANGQSKQVDFPNDSYISDVEQIKLDSIKLNIILVSAKTVNLDRDKSIDWNDPMQIFSISVDGQEKKQLTEDNFYARTWTINKQTGSIVITGHYDSNNSGKYDRGDKGQIVVVDLRSGTVVRKI